MPRPYRPNTEPTAPRGTRMKTHVRQEDRHERAIRMREEAATRQAAFDALPVSEKNERNPHRKMRGMISRPYVEVAKAA